MRWRFAVWAAGPFSHRPQLSLSGIPFHSARRPSHRVPRREIGTHLRGSHENGNGTRHDRGEPVWGLGGDDFCENGFEDGKAGVDDSEESFETGEEGDEGVDLLRVSADVLDGAADAVDGYGADAGVSLLILFLKQLEWFGFMSWEEHTLYPVQTSHSASISCSLPTGAPIAPASGGQQDRHPETS